MATHIKEVGKVVSAIVRMRSEAALLKNIPKIKEKISTDIAYWKTRYKERLNSPAVYHIVKGKRVYERNTTAWPKRRTGKLRHIFDAKTTIRWYKRTAAFKKAYAKNVFKYKIRNLIGKRPGKDLSTGQKIEDVAVTLNEMRDKNGHLKPFAGWRNRALSDFHDLIMERSRRR